MNDYNKENESPYMIRKSPSKKFGSNNNNLYNSKYSNDLFKTKNKFNIGVNTSLNNFDRDSIDRFSLMKKRNSINSNTPTGNKVTKNHNINHSNVVNIKPSDSPEKQIQAISDCLFKREIQKIC